MPSILFVTSPGGHPAPTGGGSAIIYHSLIEEFLKRNYRVGFCSLIKKQRFDGYAATEAATRANGIPSQVSLYFGPRTVGLDDAKFARDAIKSFDPDIIYCYGPEAAALAAESESSAVRVATFYDPPHTTAIYRMICDLKYGDLRAKFGAIRKWRDIFGRWRGYRRFELPRLNTANIIIGHAYNHSRAYAKQMKREVGYFPNPTLSVPQVARTGSRTPPTFIMAGNITSTVSRTGLQFFAYEVLPYIRQQLANGEMHIRIIGGGKLPEIYFKHLSETPGVFFTGYLEPHELLEEYARCTALLVPTPIPVGFRTRIIDAFRHGVPVISHSANQSGFRELQSGTNCLLASDGRGFADHMATLIARPAVAETIAANARQQFENLFSVGCYIDQLVASIDEYRVRSRNQRA